VSLIPASCSRCWSPTTTRRFSFVPLRHALGAVPVSWPACGAGRPSARAPTSALCGSAPALFTLCGAQPCSASTTAFRMRENSFKGGFHQVEFFSTLRRRRALQAADQLFKEFQRRDRGRHRKGRTAPVVTPHLAHHATGPHGANGSSPPAKELKLRRPSNRCVPSWTATNTASSNAPVTSLSSRRATPPTANAKLIREWGL